MTFLNEMVQQFSAQVPSFEKWGTVGIVVTMIMSLLFCFLGYKLLRFFTAVIGFIAGILLGIFLSARLGIGSPYGLVITLVIGIALAAVSFFLYKVGIFILTGLAFGIVAAGIAYGRLDTTIVIIIAIAAGIAAGIISMYFVRPMVILSSGLAGGFAFFSHLMTNVLPKAVPYIDQSFKTAVTLIGGILLAVLGIIFQFRHTKKEKKR
ncbi:MAG TPA: hypothetical protein PLN48_10670 [Lachnospiraceae bacterium]|nr:hypothetical protein [Lachnospiraceae bacterium]